MKHLWLGFEQLPVAGASGHNLCHARLCQAAEGTRWEPSLQFEEGIKKTVKWYLENEEWLNNVTSGDYQSYYSQMFSNRK